MRESKFFGSPAFRRLWFSQVFSSLGDWIGFVAITAIANRVGGSTGIGAVALVLAARLVPGFFFAPVAGVLLDRWNRKHVMVACDFGRAFVLCLLPFVHNLPGLVLASLGLEVLTLLWSPAKEASVPKLVRKEFLATANSLSLAAAYGTFPLASAVFAILSKVPEWLGESEHLRSLHLTAEAVALYFDALTYLLSAAVIATLAIDHGRREQRRSEDQSRTSAGLEEAREGWAYIGANPRIRAVIIGIATGLIGGGAVVPLGPNFANVVVHAGSSGYGLLLTCMGTGTALGMLTLSILQKRLPLARTFALGILTAGVSLGLAASSPSLTFAAACIGVLGICAGAVYVLGFTILQVEVVEEMRGRVFAAFYTATRTCLLIALTVAPLLSLGIDQLTRRLWDGKVHIGVIDLAVPGVRVTLWIGAVVVVAAGALALRALRPMPTDGVGGESSASDGRRVGQ